jgi:hypothetical protein
MTLAFDLMNDQTSKAEFAAISEKLSSLAQKMRSISEVQPDACEAFIMR